MRQRRFAVHLSLMAVALTALAPAAAADLPSLAGETVISGSTTGFVRVSLPVDVVVDTLAADPSPAFAIPRAGPISGLMLRAEAAPGQTAPFILGLRASERDCFVGETLVTRACKDNERLWLGGISDDQGRAHLPAGDYRLYLIASGPVARATLKLPELSGKTEFTPVWPVPAKAEALPTLTGLPASSYVELGDFGDLASNGLNFVELTDRTDVHAVSLNEACTTLGRHDDEQLAFHPGCSETEGDGGAGNVVYSAPLPGRGFASVAMLVPHPAGTYGLGGNVITGGVVHSIAGTGLWLPYEPRPGATPLVALPSPKAAVKRRHTAQKCKRKSRHRQGRRARRCTRAKHHAQRR
jgi:hypothetical protein